MKVVDLFCGAGGLSLGFSAKDGFKPIAHVDNDIFCIKTIEENKKIIGGTSILGDLTDGEAFLKNSNFKNIVSQHNGIDLVIGGPPCQAYSLAGRIRDPNGMNFDERNYLFESYLHVLKKYRPKYFVFENVVGMLSARPDGFSIPEAIYKGFNDIGFTTIDNFKLASFDLSKFGIPQKRKRVIIFGVNRSHFKNDYDKIIQKFYTMIDQTKIAEKTVKDAISDLPKIFPFKKEMNGKSHYVTSEFSEHVPRFHNLRDIKIFRILAADSQLKNPKYRNADALKELYFEFTGNRSNVHKYFVLPWGGQSNTIPAHLYKDGLRHIHPDPKQARSITVREAARLQTFPDKFIFVGSQTEKFKMIGNAVPPKFSKLLAKILRSIDSEL